LVLFGMGQAAGIGNRNRNLWNCSGGIHFRDLPLLQTSANGVLCMCPSVFRGWPVYELEVVPVCANSPVEFLPASRAVMAKDLKPGKTPGQWTFEELKPQLPPHAWQELVDYVSQRGVRLDRWPDFSLSTYFPDRFFQLTGQ